jgi:hypothetical protein
VSERRSERYRACFRCGKVFRMTVEQIKVHEQHCSTDRDERPLAEAVPEQSRGLDPRLTASESSWKTNSR